MDNIKDINNEQYKAKQNPVILTTSSIRKKIKKQKEFFNNNFK